MAFAPWKGYLRLLEKFPLLTMSTTTGTLMVAGDGANQLLIEKRKMLEYDAVRSGRFFVLGFFTIGPMMRGWYFVLDKLYAKSKGAALKMVLTDQTVASPIFISTFLGGMSVLRMEKPEVITAKLKRDLWPVLKNNWKIWPAVQFVNFYFMPLQHRVLFVNFVALFWNTYLAWVSEQK